MVHKLTIPKVGKDAEDFALKLPALIQTVCCLAPRLTELFSCYRGYRTIQLEHDFNELLIL